MDLMLPIAWQWLLFLVFPSEQGTICSSKCVVPGLM